MKILLFVLLIVLDFLAWLVVHFMCEYKYYWCDKECYGCGNWRCKYHHSNHYAGEYYDVSKKGKLKSVFQKGGKNE